MEERLYRGKDKYSGEWVVGYYCPCCFGYFPCSPAIIEKEEMEGGCWKPVEVIAETVGQYTNLTDKNGKRIFEGDVVLYADNEGYYPEEQSEFIGKIVFAIGAFGIATNDGIPIDLDFWCDNDNFVSLWELYWNLNCEQSELEMLEVIGNVYDNPELLEA